VLLLIIFFVLFHKGAGSVMVSIVASIERFLHGIVFRSGAWIFGYHQARPEPSLEESPALRICHGISVLRFCHPFSSRAMDFCVLDFWLPTCHCHRRILGWSGKQRPPQNRGNRY